MKIFLFLFPFVAFSQAISWSQANIVPSKIINNSTVSGSYAFSSSGGFSLQSQITCPGTCNVILTVLGSIDGVNYVAIPTLSTTYTASDTSLINVYQQFFKWVRISFQETTGNNATVSSIIGIKSQL